MYRCVQLNKSVLAPWWANLSAELSRRSYFVPSTARSPFYLSGDQYACAMECFKWRWPLERVASCEQAPEVYRIVQMLNEEECTRIQVQGLLGASLHVRHQLVLDPTQCSPSEKSKSSAVSVPKRHFNEDCNKTRVRLRPTSPAQPGTRNELTSIQTTFTVALSMMSIYT